MREGNYGGSPGWAQEYHGSFTGKEAEASEKDVTMKAGVRGRKGAWKSSDAGLEDGGGGHKPRDTGSPGNLEKAKKWILL